jgi:hypothetical protein
MKRQGRAHIKLEEFTHGIFTRFVEIGLIPAVDRTYDLKGAAEYYSNFD